MINRIKIISKLLLFLAVVGMFASCGYKNVEFKKVESFKILKTDKSGALVELNVLLKNPNAVAFSLTEANFDVIINQTSIGKVDLTERVRVKGHSESVHRFVVRANYQDLAVGGFSSLLSILLSKKVALKCTGIVKARAMGMSRSFPVEYSGEVPIAFDLKKLNLKSLVKGK